ncbi:MAG: hypothetical protein MJZ86_05465 [Bacteroidales bacterium]|nr:hypothetical protein [Bacteroidales bacterium]
MADNDYLIFHEMKVPQSEDKYYNSLFEELKEKCNPSNFLASFDKDKMLIANELFDKILSTTSREDTDLISLRSEAIEKLGIHFSTRRKMEELMGYLNPKLYTDRKPYDKNLVENSIYFYDKIIQNQDDIVRLEEIETEAKPYFLNEIVKRDRIKEYERQREKELAEYKETMMLGYKTCFGALLVIGLIASIVVAIVAICS